jgi:hypothetical protein
MGFMPALYQDRRAEGTIRPAEIEGTKPINVRSVNRRSMYETNPKREIRNKVERVKSVKSLQAGNPNLLY